jgi:hypothetical protein
MAVFVEVDRLDLKHLPFLEFGDKLGGRLVIGDAAIADAI